MKSDASNASSNPNSPVNQYLINPHVSWAPDVTERERVLQMRVQEMKMKIEKYSSALGLRFERQGNLIRFTFTNISASNPERAFQLAMTLDDAGRYKGHWQCDFASI